MKWGMMKSGLQEGRQAGRQERAMGRNADGAVEEGWREGEREEKVVGVAGVKGEERINEKNIDSNNVSSSIECSDK